MADLIDAPSTHAEWVVIDTETTGLADSDRIVEIAAIAVDAETMTVVDRFVTLLQPDRDTGATSVHGISADMVKFSPRFADIAEEFAEFINGRVLVAHNLKFDEGFLAREFERAGIAVDLGQGFCTWKQGTYTTLAKSCTRYGIVLEGAHRAEADALATAALLGHLEARLSAEVTAARVTAVSAP